MRIKKLSPLKQQGGDWMTTYRVWQEAAEMDAHAQLQCAKVRERYQAGHQAERTGTVAVCKGKGAGVG